MKEGDNYDWFWEPDKGFNLNKIVNWWDIAKGLGEFALELVTKRHTQTPEEYMSTHFKRAIEDQERRG